jgi:hypothetical protein
MLLCIVRDFAFLHLDFFAYAYCSEERGGFSNLVCSLLQRFRFASRIFRATRRTEGCTEDTVFFSFMSDIETIYFVD